MPFLDTFNWTPMLIPIYKASPAKKFLINKSVTSTKNGDYKQPSMQSLFYHRYYAHFRLAKTKEVPTLSDAGLKAKIWIEDMNTDHNPVLGFTTY